VNQDAGVKGAGRISHFGVVKEGSSGYIEKPTFEVHISEGCEERGAFQ